ncbi:hypothetical protein BC628DRAFT_231452 [Trametes gibbosa]|nr:hypothetical protein BC628DRAFT_231452 [Trametes gibbosa]
MPRLLALARTDSADSVPSLCRDDWTTESTLSSSPPLSSPCSPPPTGCSIMAVLGSPGYMGSLQDEQARPDAHADLLARMQLQWSWGFGRNVSLEEQSLEYCADRVLTVPITPTVISPTLSAPARVLARPRAEETRPITRESSLRRRVQTPPPLNARAIHKEALLAKLQCGSYKVQLGDIDGSDIDSGCEADDEVEWSSAVGGKTRKRGSRGSITTAASLLTELKATAGADLLQRPHRKTYAAVAASPPKVCSDVERQEPTGRLAVLVTTHEQDLKDWTSVFERRGPLVEVADA